MFKGNQLIKDENCSNPATVIVENEDVDDVTNSLGQRRPFIEQFNIDESHFSGDMDDINVLIHFPILQDVFSQFAMCPNAACDQMLFLGVDLAQKKGLCNTLVVKCKNCNFFSSFCTSKPQSSYTRGKDRASPFYDMNLRTVLAFREIGNGYEALCNFCTIMNMAKPMTVTSYENCLDEIHWAFQEESNLSQKKVALGVRREADIEEADLLDCTVSIDGAWQTRGYSSLNGVVTCMAGSTCIDHAVLTKHCKSCALWRDKDPATVEYMDWKKNHICPIDHSGSSSPMESAGAIQIFKRSVDRFNLRYTKYLGDGDSSSFSDVQEAKPYGDQIRITKLECTGHIQKRVGSRLRQLKIDWKGKKLLDGKGIGGKGRLTDAVVNKLQNYFGIAIRTNTDSIYAMKKSIYASLFHNSELDPEQCHKFCPRSTDSWRKWQKQKAEKNEPTFTPTLSIPLAVHELVLPIFNTLATDDLLSKCLHGKTQNANEALHGLIWQRCPKIRFCGKKTLQIAVASAVCHLNDGKEAIKNVLNTVALNPGSQTEQGLQRSSRKRKMHSAWKQSDGAKKRRKQLRALKKGWNDRLAQQEGETYAAGKF